MCDTVGLGDRSVSTLGAAQLVDGIVATSKLESMVQARRLRFVAELWDRRKQEADSETEYFFIDTMEAVAAEIAAAIGVTSARAAGLIRVGEALRDRLPKVAAVFADGDIDMAMIFAIVHHTELINEPDALTRVDAALAERAPKWMKHSRRKIGEYIDSWVERFDPVGVREPRKPADNRYLDVRASSQGMAGIWGNVHVDDAIVFDRRIDDLVATVCPNDPRTNAQLRADAIRPMAELSERMACTCGLEECGGEPPKPARDVVIHVIAEASTVESDGAAPGFVSGFGPIAADSLRDLAKTARLKPVVIPTGAVVESGYRPSTALAEFVRFRDLFCRFPGCAVPAAFCDIDHTIPFARGGLTHPSNLKCECRKHHLLKTFYAGPEGWTDRQLADGTVIWVSPSGRVNITKPAGALYFPALACPTGDIESTADIFVPHAKRTEMMPKRLRTRAEDVSRRHADERKRNAERLTQARRWLAKVRVEDERPPPF
jgi:hypothetical protein